MNPQREIEILREASLVQALAIELLSAAMVKLGGDQHSEAWCKAIELAVTRTQNMTIAEKFNYSQQRKQKFREWLDRRSTEQPPEKKEAV